LKECINFIFIVRQRHESPQQKILIYLVLPTFVIISAGLLSFG